MVGTWEERAERKKLEALRGDCIEGQRARGPEIMNRVTMGLAECSPQWANLIRFDPENGKMSSTR